MALVALSGAFAPVVAQDPMAEALAKGSVWDLTVGTDAGLLTLLGGSGSRTADGGWEQEYEVEWGGGMGVLRARSDGMGRGREVGLQLPGVGISCRGELARGEMMMAGTCDGPRGRDAWFAVRVGEGVVSAADAPAEATDSTETVEPGLVVEAADSGGARLTGFVTVDPEAIAAMLEARRGARARGDLQESGGDPPPLDSFLGRLTGRYDLPADQVAGRDFPAPPADAFVRQWLASHNTALLDILEGLYSAADIARFEAGERDVCGTQQPYCSLAFRQQAVTTVVAAILR
ncbi:MAG TPA: hypothetical protein VLA09_10295 [Longimicrobiales bacterium]|nr:hypothetical protein [Longimicrobiales bacterium]